MGVVKDIIDVLAWPVRWVAKRFVQQEAQSLAVKHAVTRIAIRMHVDQYAHIGKISPDEARGKAARIWESLAREPGADHLDAEDEAVLQRIKDEVTVACVPLSVWVILSAVPPPGKATAQQIGVVFRGPRGEETHTAMVLAHIQDYFPFHRPLIWSAASTTQPPDAEVSPDVSRLMKRVLDEQKVTILRVEVGPVGTVGMDFLSSGPQA